MPLAVFPLIIRRWRSSGLVCDTYEAFPHLAEYLPEDIFDARITSLKKLVGELYPNVYPDSYLFVCSALLVIAAVIFSIYARNLEISLWYPLLILLLPAILACWSSRRRSAHYTKLRKFHDRLQTLLKEMTREDVLRQVKWDFRPVRAYDNAASLHLRPPLSSYTVGLVIEATQADSADEVTHETGDVLPSYIAATQDVVLEIGPESYYDNLRAMREMDITDQQPVPMYDMCNTQTTRATEVVTPIPTQPMTPTHPPPAYDGHGDSNTADSRPT